jgi:tetratricopeptide (TPR) repeat protein
MELRPDRRAVYAPLCDALWQEHGDLGATRRVLQRARRQGHALPQLEFLQALYEDDPRAAIERLETSSAEFFGDVAWLRPKSFLIGWALELQGDTAGARRHYEDAREWLALRIRGNGADADFRLHAALGLVHAALGESEEAIREGRRAATLYPESKDAFYGPDVVLDLAWIYTRVGAHDAAVDRLEHLLSVPSRVSLARLNLDPRWRPLRGHSAFSIEAPTSE